MMGRDVRGKLVEDRVAEYWVRRGFQQRITRRSAFVWKTSPGSFRERTKMLVHTVVILYLRDYSLSLPSFF